METLDQITVDSKQRHGCVTAWLIFMIIVNALVSVVYLLATDLVVQSFGGPVPHSLIYLLGALGIANIICAVLLFQWRKVGFWGVVATYLGAFTINLIIGIDIFQSLIGLVGIAVLYIILHIKKKNVSSWESLE